MTPSTESNLIADAVSFVQRATSVEKPLAIIVAGHNGSGKSTMWYDYLVDEIQMPLINADRMMMSVLPPPGQDGHLRPWATVLRDNDVGWMAICQKGVEGFTAQAKNSKIPFAVETVFSHWQRREDGTYASKIRLIQDLQADGYFVLLIFVGLARPTLSLARVATRAARGGHDVMHEKLLSRFQRTQQAIRHAVPIADAAILLDNSRDPSRAFTMCYVGMGDDVLYDIRTGDDAPDDITSWLNIVAPPNQKASLSKRNGAVGKSGLAS